MTEFGIVVATLAALSLTVTKVVDFIRNAVDQGNRAPAWVWSITALIVGVAFAWGWGINVSAALIALVPALAQHAGDMGGTSGEILTGLAIGAGAGFFHSFLAALSSVAHRNDATAQTMSP